MSVGTRKLQQIFLACNGTFLLYLEEMEHLTNGYHVQLISVLQREASDAEGIECLQIITKKPAFKWETEAANVLRAKFRDILPLSYPSASETYQNFKMSRHNGPRLLECQEKLGRAS